MNETRVGELIGNVIVVGVLLFLAWAILHASHLRMTDIAILYVDGARAQVDGN